MYSDPTQIRKHKVTIYLNDLEADLIDAANNYMGTQKAALLRRILLAGVRSTLHGELDIPSSYEQMEGAQMPLFGS